MPRCFQPLRAASQAGHIVTINGKTHSARDSLRRPLIFSGIQPTGIPHLGNYLGALRQWKQFQSDRVRDLKLHSNLAEMAEKPALLFFSVVDLHALTQKMDRETRLRYKSETMASLLAIGLDPNISTLFYQSDVPAHSELMWILSTIASTGYLSRMTQWKTKVEKREDSSFYDTEQLKLGLFSYPVLQAADILLYNATLVPVGEDQLQHLEFARHIATSFNHEFKHPSIPWKFNIPEAHISPAKRIMSLKRPTVKMSKSDADPFSRIMITDTEDDIKRKFRLALTDSVQGLTYEPMTRPGVSNLIEIYKHTTDDPYSYEDIAREHTHLSMKAFKELVADTVIKCLSGFRDNILRLMDPGNKELEDAVAMGRRTALSKANLTLQTVQEAVGLIQPKPGKGKSNEATAALSIEGSKYEERE